MFRVTKLLFIVIMIFLFTHIVAGETADELISKGRLYESAGRYDEALELFNQAILQKPNESYVYLPKYDILKKFSKYEERDEIWELIMDILPNSTEPIYYYSFVPGGSRMCADYHSKGKDYLIYREDYNEALFYFNRVHELCPNDTDIGNVYADEGYALYKLGCYDESLKSYENALRISEEKLSSDPEREAFIGNNLIIKSNMQMISNKINPTPVSTEYSQPSIKPSSTIAQEMSKETQNISTNNPQGMPFPWFFSILGLCIGLILLHWRNNR